MTIVIAKFYLKTPMQDYGHLRMCVKDFPNEITEEHNLHAIEHKGWTHVKIRKGSYWLPQSGILANEFLENT